MLADQTFVALLERELRKTYPDARVINSGIGGNTSSQMLARLFESHRYSRGLSLLPQGSPTNNTEDVPSGRATTEEDVDQHSRVFAEGAGELTAP